MRGPKPKPPGTCPECLRTTSKWTRDWCPSCYVRLLRGGLIEKLPKKKLPSRLTSLQEEVLLGLLLGDGCLYRRQPSHTPYLAITRAAKDKTYQKWLWGVFKNLCLHPPSEKAVYDKRTQKTYHSCVLTTRRAAVFTPWYETWYPGGVKHLPKTLTLTPLSIAVWLADDGNVRPQRKSRHRMQLKLSTQGFSAEEVARLAELLSSRYSEHFHRTRAKKGSEQYYLSSADAGTRALLNEIDTYFPPGLERKTYWRHAEARLKDPPPRTSRWGSHDAPYLRIPPRAEQILALFDSRPWLWPAEIARLLGWYYRTGGGAVSPAISRVAPHMKRLCQLGLLERTEGRGKAKTGYQKPKGEPYGHPYP